MGLNIPKTFTITRVSPTIEELEFMYNWCKNNIAEGSNVLEFGAGPTTWALSKAINPTNYICMEHWIPSIKDVLDHLDNITMVRTDWYSIPDDIEYDLVFVDSSAGYPPGDSGLHRHDACEFSERLLKNGGYIMIHDWRKRSGKKSRQYLENKKYKLVDSFNGRTGVGIYKCF